MSCPREAGAPDTSGNSSTEASPASQKRLTPPEAVKVRNPFERALVHRLHRPICSPGMCKIYKKARDGTFKWEIEQHCTLMPVDIVACSSQFEPSPDPQFDKIHEETTERFFSQEVVVPSPFLQISKKGKLSVTSSSGCSVKRDSTTIVRDASSQTVLTLPPTLPPEIEAILEKYCTYRQDDGSSEGSDWEMCWMRRSVGYECYSDSEYTDDDRSSPPSRHNYERHAPVQFSPHLLKNAVSKGMKRTFGTPVGKPGKKGSYHNKILDCVDGAEPAFSPISGGTPETPASAGSLASQTISPVSKVVSSDDEHKSEAASIECSHKSPEPGCRSTRAGLLTRSASLKESNRRRSSSGGRFCMNRSSSMSSVGEARSRSVQRLDFSCDMSVDSPESRLGRFRSRSALAGSDSSGSPKHRDWQMNELHRTKSDLNIHKTEFNAEEQEIHQHIDETPIKSKSKTNAISHGINQIRTSVTIARIPMDMSLDDSVEDKDNPLYLEDKNIDFNSIDLNLLTSGSHFVSSKTNEGVSLKRLDSGFNENTTFFGRSSYYESAIKPSELTVTDYTRSTCNTSEALKEVSNVKWMRVDSGFKDETSSDNIQFYTEGTSNHQTQFGFPEANLQGPNKENVFVEDFDNFLVRASSRNEVMSISDIFADEMAMNCNFSSTPSKNKHII